MPSTRYSLLPTKTNGVRAPILARSPSSRIVTSPSRRSTSAVASASAAHFECPSLAQPLAGLDEARVDADRRVVDEDAIVHARRRRHASYGRAAIGLHGFRQIERDAGILREVIQRAEREHAKRRRRTGECSGDRADRSISATGDNGFGMLVERLSRCGRNVARDRRARGCARRCRRLETILRPLRADAGGARHHSRDSARSPSSQLVSSFEPAGGGVRFSCVSTWAAWKALARQPSRDTARSVGVSAASERRVWRDRARQARPVPRVSAESSRRHRAGAGDAPSSVHQRAIAERRAAALRQRVADERRRAARASAAACSASLSSRASGRICPRHDDARRRAARSVARWRHHRYRRAK